jgi:hypothetical protein
MLSLFSRDILRLILGHLSLVDLLKSVISPTILQSFLVYRDEKCRYPHAQCAQLLIEFVGNENFIMARIGGPEQIKFVEYENFDILQGDLCSKWCRCRINNLTKCLQDQVMS